MLAVCIKFVSGLFFFGVFFSNALAFEYLQALPEEPLVPSNNPQTADKIELGKKLFYDQILSKNNNFSCNDCHNLLTGGDDDQAYSTNSNGKLTKRSAPGLWNIGLQTVLYWDGRKNTLEEQAIDHLLDPEIMAISNMELLVSKLEGSSQYQNLFKRAFQQSNAISTENIARALASFQRALLAPNSAFDRYTNGDKGALSKTAIKGLEEFNNMGCLACHFGVNFAGPAPGPAMNMGDGFYELFPNNLGSPYDKTLGLTLDFGRYNVTKNLADKYMWRVPPLRNIALTAPYFHNGSAKTLRDAVKVMAKVQFGYPISEDQITSIVAFLNSLTGELPRVLTP